MLTIIAPQFNLSMLLLSLLSLSSCAPEFEDCFYLTDETITKSYPLDDFAQIDTFVPGHYTFKQGNEHHIKITGNPQYLDSLSSVVYNNKLVLSNRFPFCEGNAQLNVVITTPKVNHLFVDAESTITLEDFDQQEDLYVNLSKNSFLTINRFKGMRKFHAQLRDDSSIETKAAFKDIDSLALNIEGNGRFNGFTIPAKNVAITVLGKGYCEVNAIEKLHVVIKGNANVISKGMPSLYKSITGKGDVYFQD